MMIQTPVGRAAGHAAFNGGGKITRDVVLAAALEIIDRDGADGCPCACLPAHWTATR